MGRVMCVLVFAAFFIGCSPKVRFESTKPIKIDVTMRVDVYQHIAKDADMIEGQIESGASTPVKPQSALWSLESLAYAEDTLSPAVQAVVESRKARYSSLQDWEAQGVIGENYKGFVVVRKKPASSSDAATVDKLVADENANRKVIYQSLAEKNSISVEEAGIAYAPRIQKGAPSGTPIEIDVDGKVQWTIK